MRGREAMVMLSETGVTSDEVMWHGVCGMVFVARNGAKAVA